MKIVDCYWELPNLGTKTLEITIEAHDAFRREDFTGLDAGYIVVKVPTDRSDFSLGLAKAGFAFIETQIQIQKKISTFDLDSYPAREFYEHTEYRRALTLDDLHAITRHMTADMFTTDRIYLDPTFGPEVSLARYRGWLKNEFEKGDPTLQISQTLYHGQAVGFGMIRVRDNTIYGLLGGMYSEYQNTGIGLLTTIGAGIFVKKDKLPYRLVKTAISSNNMPVVQLYNYLGYKITGMTNVFVKHQ